jgi:hypothetical protein
MKPRWSGPICWDVQLVEAGFGEGLHDTRLD